MAEIGKPLREEKTKTGDRPEPTKAPEKIPAPQIFYPQPVRAPEPAVKEKVKEKVPA